MTGYTYTFQQYSKVMAALMILIIILQAVSMFYVTKYNELQPKVVGSAPHPRTIVDRYIEQVKDAHIMDTSGTYMIINNVGGSAANLSAKNQEQVTLCTQTSIHHLYHVIDLTNHWEGPISVSIFTHGDNTDLAVHSILYLKSCFPHVKRRVIFNLLFPISNSPIDFQKTFSMKISCGSTSYLRDLLPSDKNYANTKYPYPHNILRNLAIENSKTPYIFVTDMDMVPSMKLSTHFNGFINRQSKTSIQAQTAYIVPSFESKLVNFEPMSKRDLLEAWGNGGIQPFYKTVCWKCQKWTDYEKWRGLLQVAFMDVGYYLSWTDPWEPFYIARKTSLPLYDGRFKQYGFNRISQVCEMHVAGFKFAVLNNAFVIHRGFKGNGTFHSDKHEENEKNKVLFRKFKEQLKERYPNSTMQC